nr:recQ-mediated genome instability protein 2 isoform X2 [Ipomoea batatas]
MDYSLGALKILCSHLTTATEATSHSQPAFSLGGILFQRAWLQGVLVSKPSPSNDAGRFLLDDGTGVIELKLSGDYLQNDAWELGMYVMVVGGYAVRKNGTSFIKVSNRENCLFLCSESVEMPFNFFGGVGVEFHFFGHHNYNWNAIVVQTFSLDIHHSDFWG